MAVYQKALKLLYVDELLERVNKAFAPRFKPGVFEYPEFDASFQVGQRAGCMDTSSGTMLLALLACTLQHVLRLLWGDPRTDGNERHRV